MRIELAKNFDQQGDDAGPTRLVASAEASTVVAVEVFVEQQMIAPMRITLKFFGATENRPPVGFVAQKDVGQTIGDLARDLRALRLERDSDGSGKLERYGRALSGKQFSWLLEGRVFQLSPNLATRLPRLHAQICRFAQTKSKMLSHSEVARALEQGLIQALVSCLTTAKARTDGYAKRDHAGIRVRFEEVLAEHLSWPLHMPELCELIVVSDRILRSCGAEFLGMSPNQYVLLRRLEEVRRALRDADPDIVNVGEVAHRFGFTELGRFAGRYRATFGETPSTTLQRIPEARLAAL